MKRHGMNSEVMLPQGRQGYQNFAGSGNISRSFSSHTRLPRGSPGRNVNNRSAADPPEPEMDRFHQNTVITIHFMHEDRPPTSEISE